MTGLEPRHVALTWPALQRAANEVAQLAAGSTVTHVDVGRNPSRLQLTLPVPGALPARLAGALRDFGDRYAVAVYLVDGRHRYRLVERVLVEAPVEGEWSGYVFEGSGLALAMPWGIRGRSGARVERDGTVTLLSADGSQSRGHWPLAIREPSRAPGGGIEVGALPDARGREGALGLVRARWAQAALGASPVVQKALADAVARVESSDATGGYGIYRRAFDEAVGLSAVPEAVALVEPLAQWADDRVYKQLALKPWPGAWPPWSTTGFDPLGPVESRPPVSWFPRNAAWMLTLAGNPDVVRDPTLAPELAAVAREALASHWAREEGAFTPASVGNFYEWIIRQRLPARATKTIEWMGLGAKTAGYVPPTLWEGVKEVAKRTKEDLEKLEPPGGFGVYLGVGIVAAAALAAWRIVPKSS